ncbi:hypothetical protein PybrP1_010420 [[Pythium] brassicae (nom. inval.)]|nr:hypothetical protein PybrP1_010420 [[Pythium] brassicae (nom. inval.)]
MEFGDFMAAPPAEVELDRKLYTMLEIEQRRYEGFFTALDESHAGTLPRATVLSFYAKSALSDPEIAEMYGLIKSLGVLPDADAMNETEFTTGMHFIVCMTKRSLAKLPRAFPKYLFPTLDLTPRAAGSAISSMPSPEKEELQLSGAGRLSAFAGLDATVSSGIDDGRTLSERLEMLHDSTSLVQLLEKETHNKRSAASVLLRLDQSESNTLESLRACLGLIADSVEKLGYPVPPTARAMDALDDFGNLLRSHVQATKQEIQSLEISARMLSVASEVEGGVGISALDSGCEDADPFRGLAQLTQQLSAMQVQASQLLERKEQLLRQVNAKRLSATQTPPQPFEPPPPTSEALDVSVPSGSMATPLNMLAPASPAALVGVVSPSSSVASVNGECVLSAAQEVRRSESVESALDDPFAFGAPAPAQAPAAGETTIDFSWGDFS